MPDVHIGRETLAAAWEHWYANAPGTPGHLPWLAGLLDSLEALGFEEPCECLCHRLADGLGMSHATPCCRVPGRPRYAPSTKALTI